MPIRKLPENLINQIAAGEVIEKPASIIKELVENSIDASATTIEVSMRHAGKSFISVRDNGSGIAKEELPLALARHATSKLSNNRLDKISSFGFRGEALPAIASVSRITIKSVIKQQQAWQITLEGGKNQQIKPTALSVGTLIEVRDLFYAVPARLKFLRSERYEALHIFENLAALILATPYISYRFYDNDKEKFFIPAIANPLFSEDFTLNFFTRMQKLFHKDPTHNYVMVKNKFEELQIQGYIALPTFNFSRADRQFFFVNGRVVKDKLLLGAVRGAYADFITQGRHASCVLFLQLPANLIDVNVHPAKTEIRFQDPQKVRAFLYSSLKRTLASKSQKTANNFSPSGENIISSYLNPKNSQFFHFSQNHAHANQYSLHEKSKNLSNYNSLSDSTSPDFAPMARNFYDDAEQLAESKNYQSYPMGAAVAQLHLNYIITQTETGFIIIDQHAAHERIIYEEMKIALHQKTIASQRLLIPEIFAFPSEERDLLLSHKTALLQLGLEIEAFGNHEIMIQAIPAMLKAPNFIELFETLVTEFKNYSQGEVFMEVLERICATMACYGSIRSGRAMTISDMNALLRTMEKTPNSGQCNHGRPSFIEMTLHDLEKLFDRR